MLRQVCISFVVGLLVPSCAGVPSTHHQSELSETERAEYLRKGQQTAMSLKKELVSELTAAISRGGPVQAIAVCKDKAAEITQAVAKQGIRIGRTSWKLRNPANQGPPWTQSVMEGWKTTRLNTPSPAQVIVTEDGKIGYVEPLYTQPLCVNCHGVDLKPEVSSQLKKLYPQDQATGFHAGDLRGVLWVEFDR